MSKLAIERQTIVTWYTPAEKMPEPCQFVVCTVSGRVNNVQYDHVLVVANWADDDDGWIFDGFYEDDAVDLTVDAWADLEPYGVE